MSSGDTGLALFLLLLLFYRARSPLLLPELVALARRTGFPDPELAAAIAMAESGGNPMAIGDQTLGFSIGLWQINLKAHPQYSAGALMDPATNAAAAFAVSSKGTDWTHWTAFNKGYYKQFYHPKGNA